jgi:hypothetical protein
MATESPVQIRQASGLSDREYIKETGYGGSGNHSTIPSIRTLGESAPTSYATRTVSPVSRTYGGDPPRCGGSTTPTPCTHKKAPMAGECHLEISEN